MKNQRLDKVREFLNLKLSTSKELNDLVFLASEICQVPIASITFIDETTLHQVVKNGNAENAPANIAFCNYTIREKEIFIIPDTTIDTRFHNNPLVTQSPFINFYAGVPLITSTGEAIGSFCVMDHEAKKLSEKQIQSLKILANRAIQELELQLNLEQLKVWLRKWSRKKNYSSKLIL